MSALAETGVLLGAVPAFSRDHLLVRAPHLPAAREALSRLYASLIDVS